MRIKRISLEVTLENKQVLTRSADLHCTSCLLDTAAELTPKDRQIIGPLLTSVIDQLAERLAVLT